MIQLVVRCSTRMFPITSQPPPPPAPFPNARENRDRTPNGRHHRPPPPPVRTERPPARPTPKPPPRNCCPAPIRLPKTPPNARGRQPHQSAARLIAHDPPSIRVGRSPSSWLATVGSSTARPATNTDSCNSSPTTAAATARSTWNWCTKCRCAWYRQRSHPRRRCRRYGRRGVGGGRIGARCPMSSARYPRSFGWPITITG